MTVVPMTVVPMTVVPMTVTIAVCTRDRAPILAQALADLRAETGEAPGVEVLLVDNGSTDATPAVAASLAGWRAFRSVVEPVPGLSHARNRALAESTAGWIVFLDDDAFVRTGWLAALQDAIGRPGVRLVGGPIEPRFETAPPAWFDAAASRRTFGAEGPLSDAAARLGFSGGNLAVRRDALEAVGGFDPGLGMVGGALGLGEETEMAGRLMDCFGNVTWHAPGMAVEHLEPAPKQTPGYVARRAFLNGRQSWRYGSGGRARRGGVSLLKAGKQIATGLAWAPVGLVRRPAWHRALRGLATGAGALVGAVDAVSRGRRRDG